MSHPPPDDATARTMCVGGTLTLCPMPLPAHELDRLRRTVTGRSRASLTLEPVLTPDEQSRLDGLIARREAGEPLQYLEGTVEFGPLTLQIDERALIPRPETERLWEEAVGRLARRGRGR
jgi:release factor glutamine methyltransferase